MTNTTAIITQNKSPAKPRIPEVAFVSPKTGATCDCCGQPVQTPYTKPALCEPHLDLAMLLSNMQSRDLEITLASATLELQRLIDRGGDWTLTPASIEHYYDDLLDGDDEEEGDR